VTGTHLGGGAVGCTGHMDDDKLSVLYYITYYTPEDET